MAYDYLKTLTDNMRVFYCLLIPFQRHNGIQLAVWHPLAKRVNFNDKAKEQQRERSRGERKETNETMEELQVSHL